MTSAIVGLIPALRSLDLFSFGGVLPTEPITKTIEDTAAAAVIAELGRGGSDP